MRLRRRVSRMARLIAPRRGAFIVAGSAVLLFLSVVLMPLPAALKDPQPRSPVTVLDREGRLLYEARQAEYGSQDILALAEIPQEVVAALIAVEDKTFERHHGVSVRGILRAAVQNIRARRIVSGGSTITQQLVRIRLEPRHRSLLYKLWEAILAVKLDMALTKEQIVEQYLNAVYFGHQAYGLRSASRTYFGKEPQELSHAETALLIGIIQSPVALDPFQNPSGALARRDRVLGLMRESGLLTADEEQDARGEPLRLSPDRIDIRAPHFVFWVLGMAGENIVPGTALRTTLDLDLQRDAEAIVSRRLEELREKNATSAAVVVLDARNGDVLAMVGSADYFDAMHDGAVNVAVAARQPGSALKPFTYALAIEQGDTAATTVADTEVQLLTEEGNPYTPRNYDYDLHGLVRYREALANSYNIAAVRVLERVGVVRLLTLLRQASITTLTRDPEHYGLALTLGSGEVRLLELAEAYGIFARGGRTLSARAFPDTPIAKGEQILDPRAAWIITDILSDASARLPEFGEDTPLSVPPYSVAAKTGTTRNARDNWVVGYTPERIVGVWVGNADNTPMKGTTGITGAGPIFHDVMEAALRGLPQQEFPQPQGITEREICRLSGKLPSPSCPHTIREFFVAGTEPAEGDDIYQAVLVDRRNGLRAGTGCTAQVVERRVFTVFPPEVRRWAREHGYREPPAEFSPLCPGVVLQAEQRDSAGIVITQPQTGDSFLLDPLIPDNDELLILEARSSGGIRELVWLIDGRSIGSAPAPDFRMRWQPEPGAHRIEARAAGAGDTVRILVLTGSVAPF